MSKHLTFDDRLEIQDGLKAHLSFTEIGKRIGKSRTTVCREILAHRKSVLPDKGNRCIHRFTCNQPMICGPTCQNSFHKTCKTSCGDCARFCKYFEEEVCHKFEKLPYVCNGCHSRHRCFRRKMIYDAKIAQEEYAWTLSDAHKGIAISEEDLEFLDSVVSPDIKNGLSVPVIWEQYNESPAV